MSDKVSELDLVKDFINFIGYKGPTVNVRVHADSTYCKNPLRCREDHEVKRVLLSEATQLSTRKGRTT